MKQEFKKGRTFGGVVNTDKSIRDYFRTKEPFCHPIKTKTKIQCFGKKKCKTGYQSNIPNPQHLACGKSCKGGMYVTNNRCHCVCIPNNDCI